MEFRTSFAQRMKMRRLPGVLSCILLTACAGVKFGEAPVNANIPESFTKRSIYPSGVAAYDFQDLVGNVIVVESGKDPIRIEVIRPNGIEIKAIPITDSLNYYKSRIQAGAQAGGSYLAFAAKFSADQMAEFSLDDFSRAGINFTVDGVWSDVSPKIVAWVKSHPKNNANSSRVWIKSAVLTRSMYNSFSKIDADATGQVGEVTGVKSGVYRKDENTIKGTIIGFDAFDIDKLAAELEKNTFTQGEADVAIESARYSQPISGKVKF